MKSLQPPLFGDLHANSMIATAERKERPCLVVCWDPATDMVAVASCVAEGIVHWSINGPTPRNHILEFIAPFQARAGLDDSHVHFFEFDRSKVIELRPGELN